MYAYVYVFKSMFTHNFRMDALVFIMNLMHMTSNARVGDMLMCHSTVAPESQCADANNAYS